MAAILERGEGNAKRKERLAQQKKGPGVFVYDGSEVDVEHVPTPMLVGKHEPVLDSKGMPVLDKANRQVFERVGKYKRDEAGKIIMGGVPKRVEHAIDTFVLRGVEFPKGESVVVRSPAVALKCRNMGCFEEVEGAEAEALLAAAGAPASPKKRGRKARVVEGAEAEA